MIAATVSDYCDQAKRRLPPFMFSYLDGGANDEVTLRRNRTDLADIALRQRIMRNVSTIDLSTQLFGVDMALPIALAPVGLAGMYARRGEVAAARAAAERGVPLCLSTVSLCSLEEVAAATPHPPWFQLYMIRDRGFMTELIARACAVDSPVLLMTVDLPMPGHRPRDIHSGFSGAPGFTGRVRRMLQAARHPRWAW